MSLTSDAMTWYLAGIDSHDAGEFERAVEFLDAAVSADPDPVYRAALIASLLATGEYSRALPHCETMVSRSPDDHAALSALARCLDGLGRLAEAVDAQAKAVAVRPDVREYSATLVQLRQRLASEHGQ